MDSTTQDAGDRRGLGARLEAIEARQLITERLHLTARGWDRRDEALLATCYWPEAKVRHAGYDGSALDFLVFGLARTAGVIRARHLISNVVIELDGDRALAESQFAATHRRPTADGADEEDYSVGGRYLDRLERRDGDWRILFRRGVNEFERLEPRADVTLATAPPDSLGKRGPDDPLYAMQADFRAGR